MVTLTKVELNTILAALRTYQIARDQENFVEPEHWSTILDIATNGGTAPEMTQRQIDQLCERINK
jgi:hypothetical protein